MPMRIEYPSEQERRSIPNSALSEYGTALSLCNSINPLISVRHSKIIKKLEKQYPQIPLIHEELIKPARKLREQLLQQRGQDL